jgi:hypothetical protein
MTNPDPGAMTCVNCRHLGKDDNGGLQCWLAPPVVVGTAVFQPPILPGGPPRPIWFTYVCRPPTRAEWSCASFERRTGLVEPSVN